MSKAVLRNNSSKSSPHETATVKILIENWKSELIRVGNTPRCGPRVVMMVMVCGSNLGIYVFVDNHLIFHWWWGNWDWLNMVLLKVRLGIFGGLGGCWWGSGRKMVGLLFNKRRWFMCRLQRSPRRRKGFPSSCRREALSVIEFKVPIKLDITMMMMNAIKLESVIWIQFQAFKWPFNGSHASSV